MLGLLACFFEPSRFTCIPLPIGAVTLCGHCPFSVCGYRERLMSTPGHLSMMWMGRQWDPQWLPLSMTRLGSDLPWQGGQRPKTKLKDSPVKGSRGQPQRPTNRPVLWFGLLNGEGTQRCRDNGIKGTSKAIKFWGSDGREWWQRLNRDSWGGRYALLMTMDAPLWQPWEVVMRWYIFSH